MRGFFLPLDGVFDLESFLAAAFSATFTSLFFGLASPFLAVMLMMIECLDFVFKKKLLL
jgi:hypothetical protein